MALSSRYAIRVLEIIEQFHAPCTMDEFPARVLALVPHLVASERTAYNEVNLSTGRIVASMEPNQPSAEEVAAWLQPHLAAHPLISHLARTNDLLPFAISDFWSRRIYHNSAIYYHCLGILGVEDQLALPFGPAPDVLLAVTLNRSRRSFSNRDRLVLSALRPHLTQAYLRAAQTTQLQNEIARRGAMWDAIGHGALLVRPDGSVAFCSDGAARALETFCGPHALYHLQAPAPLRAWLKRGRNASLSLTPSDIPALRIPRGAAILEVRLGGTTPDGALLLLDEHSPPEVSPLGRRDELHILEDLGLTQRQSEVLLLLSRGSSNAQIAAHLGLSLHTVKRHLEAIFQRLNVQSRSAAPHHAQRALHDL